MSLRLSVSSCLMVLLVGCANTEREPTIEDNGPVTSMDEDAGGAASDGSIATNGGGSDDGGDSGASGNTSAGSTGGTTGGTTAGGSTAGTSGGTTGGATAGTTGGSTGGSTGSTGGTTGGSTSKCGAPLDATAPTAATVTKDGPLTVKSYSSGLPASSSYKSLTVFYPENGTGPYVVVMISPGLTEVLAYLQGWARRFASHGYVAVFVEANNTNSDSSQLRANGMWAGIASLKAENTRTGSPLMGKVSDCFVTSGHSLGGGASLLTAKAHPTDIKAALGFNPYEGSTNFSSIVAPTLILTGQNDTTADPAGHGRRQYDTLSANISKLYVEAAGGNHQSALSPGSVPGQYALSWIKFTVDGDARYRPFLAKPASGLSEYATTLP